MPKSITYEILWTLIDTAATRRVASVKTGTHAVLFARALCRNYPLNPIAVVPVIDGKWIAPPIPITRDMDSRDTKAAIEAAIEAAG